MNKWNLFLAALCLNLLYSLPCLNVVSQSHAGKTEKKLRDVKEKIQQEEKLLKGIKQKKTTILGSLEALDRKITLAEKKYRVSKNQVKRLAGNIRKLKKDLISLEKEIRNHQKGTARRTETFYRVGKSGILPVLFSDTSLPEKIRNLNAMKGILDADWQRVQAFRSLLQKKEETDRNLQARLKNEKQLKEEMKRHLDEEKAKRREKDGLLFGLGQDETMHERLLNELQNSEKALVRLLRKREEQESGKQRDQAGGAKPGSLASRKGRLPWPVRGDIYRKYGKTFDPVHRTTLVNRGIDIRTKRDEPVRAIWGGDVAYADWFRGYGKLLIVHHGRKDYTILSHMSRLTKREKERVEPGEVVGYAGDTGSMEGCMVHFEVWHDGKPHNPLDWIRRSR